MIPTFGGDNGFLIIDSTAMESPALAFGNVFMAEPNPISADGQFGIFLGHPFIVTDTGNECVDKFPWELAVAG